MNKDMDFFEEETLKEMNKRASEMERKEANVIKGFIEVTANNTGSKFLVNVNYVHHVCNSRIYSDPYSPDHLLCKESYEEIIDKIRKATR